MRHFKDDEFVLLIGACHDAAEELQSHIAKAVRTKHDSTAVVHMRRRIALLDLAEEMQAWLDAPKPKGDDLDLM